MFLKRALDRSSAVLIQNPLLRSCLSTWKPLSQRTGFARIPTRGLLTYASPSHLLNRRIPTISSFGESGVRRFATSEGKKDASQEPKGTTSQEAKDKKTAEEQEQERINREKEQEREKEGSQREKEKTALGGRLLPVAGALLFTGACAYVMSQKDFKIPTNWNDALVDLLSTLTDMEPNVPRLPPLILHPNQQKQMTLVIDSSELYTPEWTDKGWIRKRRPKTHFAISTLFQHYEIVVWHTNEWREAAQQNPEFIDKLDPYRMCHHLFYEDLAIRKMKKAKDINLLGRDPANVVILTSNPDEYPNQENNIIKMKPWKGEPNNSDLADVIFFLDELASVSPPDVRDVVSRFKNKDIPSLWRPRRIQYEQLIRQQASKQKSKDTSKGGFLGKLGL